MDFLMLFSQAFQCLIKQGDVHLVKIRPHSALKLPIKQIRKEVGVKKDRLPHSMILDKGTRYS